MEFEGRRPNGADPALVPPVSPIGEQKKATMPMK